MTFKCHLLLKFLAVLQTGDEEAIDSQHETTNNMFCATTENIKCALIFIRIILIFIRIILIVIRIILIVIRIILIFIPIIRSMKQPMIKQPAHPVSTPYVFSVI